MVWQRGSHSDDKNFQFTPEANMGIFCSFLLKFVVFWNSMNFWRPAFIFIFSVWIHLGCKSKQYSRHWLNQPMCCAQRTVMLWSWLESDIFKFRPGWSTDWECTDKCSMILGHRTITAAHELKKQQCTPSASAGDVLTAQNSHQTNQLLCANPWLLKDEIHAMRDKNLETEQLWPRHLWTDDSCLDPPVSQTVSHRRLFLGTLFLSFVSTICECSVHTFSCPWEYWNCQVFTKDIVCEEPWRL